MVTINGNYFAKINTSSDEFDVWVGAICGSSYRKYLQKGWPFLITNDTNWHFITNVKKLTIGNTTIIQFYFELPKDYDFQEDYEFVPLNQFENNIENEEIVKYVTRL